MPQAKSRGGVLTLALALFLVVNAALAAWLFLPVLQGQPDAPAAVEPAGPAAVTIAVPDLATSAAEAPPAAAPAAPLAEPLAAPSAEPPAAPPAAAVLPPPAPTAPATDTPPGGLPDIAPGAGTPAAQPAGALTDPAMALAAAPDPALIEKTADGALPIIAADGREARQVYARPFKPFNQNPRVALIIGDLGLNPRLTRQAITALPPDISLAFTPYAKDIGQWLNDARGSGHEVLLQLPMEPLDFPASDPGPQAMLTTLSATDNLTRLNWILARGAGYIGLLSSMGSKFSTSAGDLAPILEAMRRRGLLFIDSRSSAQSAAGEVARGQGLAFIANNRFIDNTPSAAAIDTRLAELEQLAMTNGAAVGIGSPYPITVERVTLWAAGLGRRGIVLAPVSALTGRQGAIAKP